MDNSTLLIVGFIGLVGGVLFVIAVTLFREPESRRYRQARKKRDSSALGIFGSNDSSSSDCGGGSDGGSCGGGE